MTAVWPQPLSAVWFDLDGTLIDSAPDLYRAMLALCAEQGVDAPGPEAFRERVSRGGLAMLRSVFADADPAMLDHLLPRFLELYAQRMDVLTRLFDGMALLLDALDQRGMPWGIVTNKSAVLGEPLLARLRLAQRAAACVYGDTLPVRKPDPAPLLLACQKAEVPARQCVYIGDDERDIQAARGAGMVSIVAGWGYLDGGEVHTWGADHVAATVNDLARLLVA